MKKIEKYVTKDGAEFDTEEEASHREYLLDEKNRINSILPDHPDTSDFANGHGYIQHYRKNVIRARNMLYEMAIEISPSLSKYDIKDYGFLRTLDDGNNILLPLYYRIVSCMDEDTWREYGQPYFVSHPDRVEKICINED